MNKNKMKIIKSLTYFSANEIRQEQKPYLSKGVLVLQVGKRAFHNKMALSLENLTPKIFIKKINIDKVKTIPLNTQHSLGYFRHFPATNTEWSSSIYAHNNNNHIKSLPILDKNIVKLLKSFFNFYHISELLKTEHVLLRFRRTSLKKIFVSKAELKHTNSKVIINIHVYNLQKRLLMFEINWMEKYADRMSKNILKIYSRCTNDIDRIKTSKRYFDFLDEVFNLRKYYYFLMRSYTLFKFELYIPKLMDLIRNIYKKKVEINIVILKHMYLNSDILSQAIALKLKDRNNRVWRVLRSCLSMVEVPNANKYKEKSKANRIESLIDIIKKLDINSFTSLAKERKCGINYGPALNKAYFYSPFMKGAKKSTDRLNGLLFGTMPILPEGKHEEWYFFFENCLKYRAIGGVRLEAKGRLTRRFTASRSVFKLNWKGGLKNIDSSYKELSAVILRGHVKSNVQYTLINSKNRNGAYGVKGWVSGK
jgi:hypothetical protein